MITPDWHSAAVGSPLIHWNDPKNHVRVYADTLIEFMTKIHNPNDTKSVRKFLADLDNLMDRTLRALDNFLKVYKNFAVQHGETVVQANRDALEEFRRMYMKVKELLKDSPLLRTDKLLFQLNQIARILMFDDIDGSRIHRTLYRWSPSSRQDWIDDKHLFNWLWFDLSVKFPTDEQLEATLAVAAISIDQAIDYVEQMVKIGV